MSSMIVSTSPTEVFVATDTLCVSAPGGEPLRFQSKALLVPHLRMVAVVTGLTGVLERWLCFLNSVYVPGLEGLDQHATELLQTMWANAKRDLAIPEGMSTTVHHFGFSEVTGEICAFQYSALNDFASERLPVPGLFAKPTNLTLPSDDVELPRDLRTIMELQREGESKSPVAERLYIGGEMWVHHLTNDGFNVYLFDRFDDAESDEAIMRNRWAEIWKEQAK